MQERALPQALRVQQQCFQSGETLPLPARMALLRALRLALHAMEGELLAALEEDLGKSAAAGYLSELGQVYAEVRHMLARMKRYASPRPILPSAGQLPGRGERRPVPKGNVLVIAPWNYPILLSLLPAVDAIAAGNTVIIKPSELAPASAAALQRLCQRYLPEKWISVLPGDAALGRSLLDQPFHHIFYTGGAQVGRLVLQRAARRLCPVTLELGGKSPCIVAADADVSLAARRIVFGKFLNCGQSCVAPDYVYVQESLRPALLGEMARALRSFYGRDPLESRDYGRIVNRAQFDRLSALLEGERPWLGGERRPETLQIAPTILEAGPESPLMEEEIFGPILPVLSYRKLDDALAEIQTRPTPLACYLFTRDKALQTRLMATLPFGGGCVNDTLLQLASPRMGFGGLGESGMGAYHGRVGFETFSHQKHILYQSSRVDLPLRYPPYGRGKALLLRALLR